MYRTFRLFLLAFLYEIPFTRKWAYRRLPRHRSGYKAYWVNKGYAYRSNTLETDQERSAMKQHPTAPELIRAVSKYTPKKVLDLGCGYGRYLEVLAERFDAEGCDISNELLDQAGERGLDVFYLDIVDVAQVWVDAHKGDWDVVFSWCVYMYFIDNPKHMFHAMENADKMAAKKVIVWDWKHVCDYMKSVYPSDKFEYHYIPVWKS